MVPESWGLTPIGWRLEGESASPTLGAGPVTGSMVSVVG